MSKAQHKLKLIVLPAVRTRAITANSNNFYAKSLNTVFFTQKLVQIWQHLYVNDFLYCVLHKQYKQENNKHSSNALQVYTHRVIRDQLPVLPVFMHAKYATHI